MDYKPANTNGSAYDLSLANMNQQTEAHAALLAHLGRNSGGKRKTKSRTERTTTKSRTERTKTKSRTTRRRIRGGAVEFALPDHIAEPPAGQSNYPVQGVLGNLLAVGAQHTENSRFDGDMNAPPLVMSKAPTGGRRKRKSKSKRRRGMSKRRRAGGTLRSRAGGTIRSRARSTRRR